MTVSGRERPSRVVGIIRWVPLALVVEDNPSGHRLMYVRELVRFGCVHGWTVHVAFTPLVIASPQKQLLLPELPAGVELITFEGEATAPTLARLSHRSLADVTIITDGDELAMRLALAPRWRGHGVLSMLAMRDPGVEHAQGAKRRAVLGLKSLLFRTVDRRRNLRLHRLRSGLDRPAPRVAIEPVPCDVTAEETERLRTEWQITDGMFWVAVVGAIGTRKNLPAVIETVRIHADRHGADAIGLLVAGQMHDDVRTATAAPLDELRRAGVTVRVIDRLLSDSEVDTAIDLCDCVVVAHSLEAPSAVIAKAGALGTRVLGAGAQSVKRDTQVLPAARWAELDPSAMADMLAELIAIPEPIEQLDLGSEQFCAALYGVTL